MVTLPLWRNQIDKSKSNNDSDGMVQVVVSGVLMWMVVVVGAGSVLCGACYYGVDG